MMEIPIYLFPEGPESKELKELAAESWAVLELYGLGLGGFLLPFNTYTTKKYEVGWKDYKTIFASLFVHNCRATLIMNDQNVLTVDAKRPVASVAIKAIYKAMSCPVEVQIKLENRHPVLADVAACAIIVMRH